MHVVPIPVVFTGILLFPGPRITGHGSPGPFSLPLLSTRHAPLVTVSDHGPRITPPRLQPGAKCRFCTWGLAFPHPDKLPCRAQRNLFLQRVAFPHSLNPSFSINTTTDNDDFGARYYSNRFGRWLSADWSAVPVPVPVPYANLTNPQTLNLYAMVADDPESCADLDGHDGPSLIPPGLELDPEVMDAIEVTVTVVVTTAETGGSWLVKGGVAGVVLLALQMAGDNPPPRKKEGYGTTRYGTTRWRGRPAGRSARKGQQERNAIEHMTDEELRRIARDKKDPRRRAAQREEKVRGTRRSRESKDNKKPPDKKKPPNKPPAQPEPQPPPDKQQMKDPLGNGPTSANAVVPKPQ